MSASKKRIGLVGARGHVGRLAHTHDADPDEGGFHGQSIFAPEDFTTGVQRTISALIMSVIWSAVPGMMR